MSMHLTPVYYTTTNTKKRKQKGLTAKDREAQIRHEKFLKKMGVTGKSNYKHALPNLKSDIPSLPTSDVIPTVAPRKARHEVTSDYVIGPAYNKGAYQVLSKQEVQDPMTGKRR